MGETAEVRFEPCPAWAAGPDPDGGSCTACGWLEEDHWLAELELSGAVPAPPGPSGGGPLPSRALAPGPAAQPVGAGRS